MWQSLLPVHSQKLKKPQNNIWPDTSSLIWMCKWFKPKPFNSRWWRISFWHVPPLLPTFMYGQLLENDDASLVEFHRKINLYKWGRSIYFWWICLALGLNLTSLGRFCLKPHIDINIHLLRRNSQYLCSICENRLISHSNITFTLVL